MGFLEGIQHFFIGIGVAIQYITTIVWTILKTIWDIITNLF